jgi:hypothetical protein
VSEDSAGPSPVTGDVAQDSPAGVGDGDGAGVGMDDLNQGSGTANFAQAYASGRHSLGPAAYLFGAQFGGGVRVGDTLNVFTGRSLALAPGPVREEDLDWVRRRYVPSPTYERIRDVVVERRLVVLCGYEDTGRATTALRVLDEVAKGKVFRLDGDADLTLFKEKDFERDGGYLTRLTGASLSETQLDRLSALLAECECFGVLLVERVPQAHDDLGGYLLDCPPPEPAALLKRHVFRELRHDDEEGLEDRLVELAGQPRFRSALGPRPRPLETLWFAQLLVGHGRGELSLDNLDAECAKFVSRQVTTWFAGLQSLSRGEAADEALRLAGFRIALAVFNSSPYHFVRDAGETLAEKLMLTISPRRNLTMGRPPFSDDQEDWLAAARATLVDGHMSYNGALVPVQMAEFEDSRFPRGVLTYVWSYHHNIRKPLLEWLTELGRDTREFVWVRAAQAAGLLCAEDFPYVFHTMDTLAASDQVQERHFAAVALDQAALDDRAGPAIGEVLRSWRRETDTKLQWTVACALGLELGTVSIMESLTALQILGTQEETDSNRDRDDLHRLTVRSGQSMARLFFAGAERLVADRLTEWLAPKRRKSLHKLASVAVLNLAYIRVHQLGDRTSLPQERSRWPALLALIEEDTELADPAAALVLETFRGKYSKTTEIVLVAWMRVCERDEACLDALARFLPRLVRNESDYKRLRYLIEQLRRDWMEALRDDVADRLEAAIDPTLVLRR